MDYGDANIAAIGSLLADPGRCQVLTALGDGRALPASMLAAEAGVAPSTASEHLARLVDAGLLTVERHGRHRYFRIAGPEVAELLEAMARVAPPSKVVIQLDFLRPAPSTGTALLALALILGLAAAILWAAGALNARTRE